LSEKQHEPFFEAKSGLPRHVERQLMRHYGQTPAGRIRLAAVLRALGVLARRHPKATLDALGAGAVQAARTGVRELNQRLSRYDEESSVPERTLLTRRERRRFRRLLDRAANDDG
jgi:hypothetical protein